MIWAKADVLVTEPRTITIGADGYNPAEFTIKFVDKHTVTFVDSDGTTVLKEATLYDNGTTVENIAKPADPTKAADSTCNTYKFNGWTPTIVDVTADATYKATYTCTSKKSSYSWWGGGGGSSSYSCKNLPDNAVKNNSTSPKSDTNYSYDTDTTKVCTFQCDKGYKWNEKAAKCEKSDSTNTEDTVDSTDTTNPDSDSKEWTDGSKAETYSDELVAAYKWAYGQGITTMPTIQKAKLNNSITREQLAKMMVQFMSKVLDKKPIKTDTPDYEDVKVETRGQEMYDFVTLAYQYQIMGIDANGNALKKFKPTGTVSRAEFATVLSRVLFGSAYNQNSGNYRELHIQALNKVGILTNTNPTITELRGWILLMLYRSRNIKIEPKATTPAEEATPSEEATPTDQSDENKSEESEWTWAVIGMPNPASVYCEEQWGKLSIVKDAEWNESGMCKLADGTEVEEWAYYRANHADEAASTQEAKPAEESSTSEETKSE